MTKNPKSGLVIFRKLATSSRKQVPYEVYKRLSGKNHSEVLNVFEKEMQLGVLSNQSKLYPLPGLQRACRLIPIDSVTKHESNVKSQTRLQQIAELNSLCESLEKDQRDEIDDSNLIKKFVQLEEKILLERIRLNNVAIEVTSFQNLLRFDELPILTTEIKNENSKVLKVIGTFENGNILSQINDNLLNLLALHGAIIREDLGSSEVKSTTLNYSIYIESFPAENDFISRLSNL